MCSPPFLFISYPLSPKLKNLKNVNKRRTSDEFPKIIYIYGSIVFAFNPSSFIWTYRYKP